MLSGFDTGENSDCGLLGMTPCCCVAAAGSCKILLPPTKLHAVKPKGSQPKGRYGIGSSHDFKTSSHGNE
jgi:hypothetical protein